PILTLRKCRRFMMQGNNDANEPFLEKCLSREILLSARWEYSRNVESIFLTRIGFQFVLIQVVERYTVRQKVEIFKKIKIKLSTKTAFTTTFLLNLRMQIDISSKNHRFSFVFL